MIEIRVEIKSTDVVDSYQLTKFNFLYEWVLVILIIYKISLISTIVLKSN